VAVSKPSTLPIPDRAAVGEIVTSSTGFQARVIPSEMPALMRDKGITDQFVDPGRVTTFNLPNDAFAHTRSEAVLTVVARQTNGDPLPPWVQFNAQSGSFTVAPPPGFNGQIEIQVAVRDNDGREATANFKFNVGSGTATDSSPTPAPATAPIPPQGRLGVTDQIRLAGRQNALLDRLMASRAVQDRLQERSIELRGRQDAPVRGREDQQAERTATATGQVVPAGRVASAERVQSNAVPRPGA
jgi:hypothetical protein